MCGRGCSKNLATRPASTAATGTRGARAGAHVGCRVRGKLKRRSGPPERPSEPPQECSDARATGVSGARARTAPARGRRGAQRSPSATEPGSPGQEPRHDPDEVRAEAREPYGSGKLAFKGRNVEPCGCAGRLSRAVGRRREGRVLSRHRARRAPAHTRGVRPVLARIRSRLDGRRRIGLRHPDAPGARGRTAARRRRTAPGALVAHSNRDSGGNTGGGRRGVCAVGHARIVSRLARSSSPRSTSGALWSSCSTTTGAGFRALISSRR